MTDEIVPFEELEREFTRKYGKGLAASWQRDEDNGMDQYEAGDRHDHRSTRLFRWFRKAYLRKHGERRRAELVARAEAERQAILAQGEAEAAALEAQAEAFEREAKG